jgi:hypothetical protein
MPYCDKCRLRRARHVLAHAGAYNIHLCQECFQAEHPRLERRPLEWFPAAGCLVWLALVSLSGFLFYAWLH